MKKLISVLLVVVLVFGLVTMTGCAGNKKDNDLTRPYDEYDLAKYVKLADYNNYTATAPEVTVTDEDVQEGIDYILKNNPLSVEVQTGTVMPYEKIAISFKGVLDDGSTPFGMESNYYDYVCGIGGMIPGFDESIIGKKVGETVSFDVTFPDPYETQAELSGQHAVFTVGILSRFETRIAELTDEFVSNNTAYKTVAELKDYLYNYVKEQKEFEKISDIKEQMLTKIIAESTVSELLEEKIKYYVDVHDQIYKGACTAYGLDWDNFLKVYEYTQETYDKALREEAEDTVKADMVVFAIAQKEDIKVKESSYQDIVAYVLKATGITSEEEFASNYGMPVELYAEYLGATRGLYADAFLGKLYEDAVARKKG